MAHLRGDRALPDERVQAVLVVLDLALDVRRRDRRRGRADGLVGFLGVLRLGLVDARLLGHLVLAVQPGGDLADLRDRLGGQRHRVGAHVGDQADAALADVLALVQLLREAHGAARVEAELARGLLLQGGGGEGRRGVAAALLALDRVDGELTVWAAALRVCSTSRACASSVELNCSTFCPRYSSSFSGKLWPECVPSPSSVQYSWAMKAWMAMLAMFFFFVTVWSCSSDGRCGRQLAACDSSPASSSPARAESR